MSSKGDFKIWSMYNGVEIWMGLDWVRIEYAKIECVTTFFDLVDLKSQTLFNRLSSNLVCTFNRCFSTPPALEITKLIFLLFLKNKFFLFQAASILFIFTFWYKSQWHSFWSRNLCSLLFGTKDLESCRSPPSPLLFLDTYWS